MVVLQEGNTIPGRPNAEGDLCTFRAKVTNVATAVTYNADASGSDEKRKVSRQDALPDGRRGEARSLLALALVPIVLGLGLC